MVQFFMPHSVVIIIDTNIVAFVGAKITIHKHPLNFRKQLITNSNVQIGISYLHQSVK